MRCIYRRRESDTLMQVAITAQVANVSLSTRWRTLQMYKSRAVQGMRKSGTSEDFILLYYSMKIT